MRAAGSRATQLLDGITCGGTAVAGKGRIFAVSSHPGCGAPRAVVNSPGRPVRRVRKPSRTGGCRHHFAGFESWAGRRSLVRWRPGAAHCQCPRSPPLRGGHDQATEREVLARARKRRGAARATSAPIAAPPSTRTGALPPGGKCDRKSRSLEPSRSRPVGPQQRQPSVVSVNDSSTPSLRVRHSLGSGLPRQSTAIARTPIDSASRFAGGNERSRSELRALLPIARQGVVSRSRQRLLRAQGLRDFRTEARHIGRRRFEGARASSTGNSPRPARPPVHRALPIGDARESCSLPCPRVWPRLTGSVPRWQSSDRPARSRQAGFPGVSRAMPPEPSTSQRIRNVIDNR